MRNIELTKGYRALVDDEDYEWLNKFNWQVLITKDVSPKYYAQRTYRDDGGIKRSIRMHREILELKDKTILVDHIDGNGLNNQRANLRIASVTQNGHNAKKKLRKEGEGTSSKYKGVRWMQHCKRWEARIQTPEKQRIVLGYFNIGDEDAAGRAYDSKAKELFGKFAKLNFPEEKRNE